MMYSNHLPSSTILMENLPDQPNLTNLIRIQVHVRRDHPRDSVSISRRLHDAVQVIQNARYQVAELIREGIFVPVHLDEPLPVHPDEPLPAVGAHYQ